jgi:hypothetical protein
MAPPYAAALRCSFRGIVGGTMTGRFTTVSTMRPYVASILVMYFQDCPGNQLMESMNFCAM